MDCSRCNAEAVVKRGSAAYCARCALARDWEDVIAAVQEDRVDVGAAADAPAKKAATKAPAATVKASAGAAKATAAVAAEANGNSGLDDLPADPFA